MIFRGVKYYLPSNLTEDRRSKLGRILEENHATRADSLYEATHVITNSETFEGWQEVGAETVVVTELWVERSISARKIQQPNHYSAARAMIFSGVVACSADLHPSDEDVITVGITTLGGQFRMGLTKDVTHLFAVSPASEKYSTGMSHRDQTGLTILVPDWFDDSVQLGMRDLSTATYEWPEPEVLNRRPQTPTRLKQKQRSSMSPEKKALYTTASWDSDSSKPPPNLITKDVWGGRSILLSSSLELTGQRRLIVENGIRKAKGVPVTYSGEGTAEEEVDLLAESDILVTRHRVGPVFFKAWRAGKTIGTLSWLLNAQVIGVYSSPMDQLLHFPIHPGTVEGFEDQSISVTNYAGEMRDYLKRLITLMGGNFTPNLTNKNTVLVAASMSGSKTGKAAEWSIPIVNHTWLEDCFLRWRKLTPASPKYVSYPPGVDFSNLLGERGVAPEIQKIIEEEAREAEDAELDDDSRHNGSQVSVDDETEVAGLLPAMDLDGEEPRHATPTPSSKKSATKSKSQSRTIPPSTPKSAAKSKPVKPSAAAHSEEDGKDEDEDSDVPLAHRSPRRVLGPQATTSKLPPLGSDSDDLDDLPVELAPPPRTAKPTRGAARAPSSEPPKKSAAAAKASSSRKAAATPTPPSSPLVTAISHHRAAPASASAPPRSRTTGTRASSSASTAIASSGAPGPAPPPVVENGGGRGKREAATRANQRLHDEIMPDLVNFENERRNRGRKSQSRRLSGRAEMDDGDEEEEEAEPSAKRRKLDGGKRGRPSVSDDETTMQQPAKAKPRKSDVPQRFVRCFASFLVTERTLSKLGVKSTLKATECTHLVVPDLVRTENFLCALTAAPFILRREWAVDSAAAEKLLPEEDYILQDDAGDRKYKFSLAQAVARAKALKGTLFKGHTFYITKNVKAMNIVRNVVIANGGQAITNQQPSLRTLETDTNRHVISCTKDAALWRQIAENGRPIYNYELVLTNALRQEIDWDDAAFKVDPDSEL
ncbi:hypothetical protein C8R46DRAFT_877027 [Mycena filopes]|nr:hypothetical protein C8R46DRAFT_877027 [Mycena filopes]